MAVKRENETLVSFYMTVRNGGSHISTAINSILSQTYSNLEVVIVDDGSTDDTVSYLKHLEHMDKRVSPIYTSGVGRGKALNIALNNTKGHFIANLDADDVSHPQRVEIQLQEFVRNPTMSIVGSNMAVFDVDVPLWRLCELDRYDSINVSPYDFMINNALVHSSVMMRRSDIIGIGGYDESRVRQLDYDLWVRCVENGLVIRKVLHPLCGKRVHEHQSFENKKRVKYILSSFNLQMSLISTLKGGLKYKIIAFVRLAYAFLPQKLRTHIRRKLTY